VTPPAANDTLQDIGRRSSDIMLVVYPNSGSAVSEKLDSVKGDVSRLRADALIAEDSVPESGTSVSNIAVTS
jgi:hypothetical protein